MEKKRVLSFNIYKKTIQSNMITYYFLSDNEILLPVNCPDDYLLHEEGIFSIMILEKVADYFNGKGVKNYKRLTNDEYNHFIRRQKIKELMK